MARAADIARVTAAAIAIAAVAVALYPGQLSSPGAPRDLEEARPAKAAKILFVGDLMFDRTIRKAAEREGYGYPLSCVAGYLQGFDLVVGNLEGPITGYPSRSRDTVPGDPGNTSFTFDPVVATALAASGRWVAHLGNNHIRDFGEEGAAETAARLAAAGVPYFGIPGGQISATTTAGGIRIALVSFNQFLGQGDPERTIEAIRALRPSSDLVAVYAHWGDEYEPENNLQRSYARAFVEAGADVVVGSHPHVIQSVEDYLGGKIYYSLGNFVFDQYWTESVRTGLGVELAARAGETAFEDIVFELERDGATCRADIVEKGE